MGSVSAVQAAAAVLLAVPLVRRVPAATIVAGLVLAAAVVGRYGGPSVGRARAILDDKYGGYTADVLAAGCPGLGGDYWVLWPTLWHVDLTRYERGESLGVVPVGNRRAWPWAGDRPAGGPFRVAVPKGHVADSAEWLPRQGLEPYVRVGEYNSLDLFTTRPRPSAETR
jgi:hypothetical protein